MDRSLLYQVTHKYFSTSAAYLKDFRKLTSHLGYPYILPHKGYKVEGLLIRDIDPDSIKRLDQYEGRLYPRRKLAVVSGGKRVSCEAYVGNRKLSRSRSSS